jgi:glycosyltransferase involved in cell wall biosynthesis
MTIGEEEVTTWELPTRRSAAWFHVRVWCHVLRRALRDVWRPAVQRHSPSEKLKNAPVIAERRTALWRDGRDDEFPLVAGKVQNLRLARSAFDGVEVSAGSVFSFWRQLGRPSRWRGFVEGREIQAGCVVPTIAGGLCQLSNALASSAADVGITFIERHGHTARVERDAGLHSLGLTDATVFWNYIDLRFRADFDFRIEVELTSDELVVRLRAAQPLRPIARKPLATVTPIGAGKPSRPVARGCMTCNEMACFRHRTQTPQRAGGSTAVLVDVWTPEFARHLHSLASEAEWLIPWVRSARRVAGSWTPPASRKHTVAFHASLRRTLHLRRNAGEGRKRQAAILQGNRWLAERYARSLESHHTHLVIDQSLIVPLAETGALGGRTYEVLVHALPADELQRRLDAAGRRRPDAASLRDFRVGENFCAIELNSLRNAQRIVTPHAEVARYLRACLDEPLVQTIDWILPSASGGQRISQTEGPPLVAFPASALARKGAHEMAEAMRYLGWRLLVLGTPPSDPQLWSGIDVTYLPHGDPTWLAHADIVALPAYVEHSPRGLLAAISHGLPVVASRACGLPSSLNPIEVPAGETSSLIAGLRQALRLRCGQ